MPRARSWQDDDLRRAVAASTTWSAVARALRLRPGGATRAVLRRHAARLGLDVDHLPGLVDGRAPGRRRFDDAQLHEAVSASTTMAEVMRRPGYRPSGGTHRFLASHIERLGLDTTHFLGTGWSRGVRTGGGFRARPLEDVLREGTPSGGSRLLRRLIDAGLKLRACEGCGGTEWLGLPIPLQLHHRNGTHTDNRLANLQALCPNCHALTTTYCGRNRGRVVELADTAALGAVASA